MAVSIDPKVPREQTRDDARLDEAFARVRTLRNAAATGDKMAAFRVRAAVARRSRCCWICWGAPIS
jgi:hypothetical protein